MEEEPPAVFSSEVQLSFFPTEQAQIAQIGHAESVQPSAFSFAASVSEEEVVQALQVAVSEPASRMRVATEFSKGKSTPELILALQKEYQGGTGISRPHRVALLLIVVVLIFRFTFFFRLTRKRVNIFHKHS